MIPKIGVPLDFIRLNRHIGADWYAGSDWYAIRYRYHDAICANGGLPFFLGYNFDLIDAYCESLDGLLIAGGNIDHEPILETNNQAWQRNNNPDRTKFESAILSAFIKTKKPVLTVCGGYQLLNKIYGGSLYKDLETECTGLVESHVATQDNPPVKASHRVSIVENTLLHTIAQETTANVNSDHHQAIKTVGDNLTVNAYSEKDRVIEGVELNNHPFCVGVQWHPEFFIDNLDHNLFKCFIQACA